MNWFEQRINLFVWPGVNYQTHQDAKQVKINSLYDELLAKIKTEIFELDRVVWHGLNKDEPLTVEGIIKSAFENPYRITYPEFLLLRGNNFTIDY